MRKLHPATIIVGLLPSLKEALRTTFPLLIGSVVSGHSGNGDWIAAAIGGFTGIFAIGAYWTTRFDIEPDHIVRKTGWIFRKDRRIPLAQIQNVSIRQNVLERIFKVATVDVETAMGHGRDLKLSVLGLADAERFREELLGAAHLNAGETPKLDEPLITLNRHDLLLGAFTENHFPQMIVGMFTIGGPLIGFVVNYASKLPPTMAALLFGAGFIALGLGCWLWGAGSYYLKYGGFEVRRSENIFRITYGLLNKVQTAIRPSRIEYVQVTTTLPQRFMMRSSLHVGTASTFGEAGVLAPVALFVERYRAYAGVWDVIPGLDIAKLQWSPFHPLFYRAAVVRGIVTTLVSTALAAWITSLAGVEMGLVVWSFWAFVELCVVARLVSLFLARPENGFAITEDALVVRQGYYHQSISAMPIERVENMAIQQPWWWLKRSAVTLAVQGMKHRVHVGALLQADVRKLELLWYEKIEQRERNNLYEAISQDADSTMSGDMISTALDDLRDGSHLIS